MTLGVCARIASAMRFGIPDAIKNDTVPIVPQSIKSTLKSIA
jgi:hypothetical protein